MRVTRVKLSDEAIRKMVDNYHVGAIGSAWNLVLPDELVVVDWPDGKRDMYHRDFVEFVYD
jgi:hypothetical protein